MKSLYRNLLLTAAALTLSLTAISCSSAEKIATTSSTATTTTAGKGAKTLENLQTAFNGESNANAKYLAFAKKADDEGYTKVASLFRAAARAEEIHMNNHSEVIKKMGGSPTADLKPAEIRTTAENLKGAIEGESYERDKMYTDFIAEARSNGNTDALKTFNFAKVAEGEHAKLYAEALANLADWKGGKTTFFVCSSCGYTTTDVNLQKCPVDFTPKEKFESIS